MTTYLYTHNHAQNHNSGENNDLESPDRVKSPLAALRAKPIPGVYEQETPLASYEQLLLVHPWDYIRAIEAGETPPNVDYRNIPPDINLDPNCADVTAKAARLAVGGICAAIDSVMMGQASNAFILMRPPGHHAEPETPMGFCYYATVAIGAAHALERYPLKRIAIVDFDFHHGNGTEVWARNEPRVSFFSTHTLDYPETGMNPEDHGVHDNIFNFPYMRSAPMDSDCMRKLYSEEIIPKIDLLRPELILISAGYDAHADDPLCKFKWCDDDYRWLTNELMQCAKRAGHSRVVMALEGGYNIDVLTRCIPLTLQTLAKGLNVTPELTTAKTKRNFLSAEPTLF